MEKRISYSQFQQVKSTAKVIDPCIRKIEALKNKIVPLQAEMESYQAQIDLLEAGIVKIIGFHVGELVKKVIEPTGKTDANGKPLMVTKYLPTDIVSYDEQEKQYVINIPEPEIPQGSDGDIDVKMPENEVKVLEEEEEPTPVNPIYNPASFE